MTHNGKHCKERILDTLYYFNIVYDSDALFNW